MDSLLPLYRRQPLTALPLRYVFKARDQNGLHVPHIVSSRPVVLNLGVHFNFVCIKNPTCEPRFCEQRTMVGLLTLAVG